MQVQSLGRYRVEKELGRGAMGRVFLAHDPDSDRRVAIKTIQIFASLPEVERAQARDRFLREAKSAGKLLHPGIVTIFDVGEADGLPYIAMEYVEGETLDAACRPEALLPVPTLVELMAFAAEALAFAHERGVIHRDIKPANLMRVADRGIKIMDFGLAKSGASSMTHDGALFGTPNYMSPEQVRGDRLDGRSDLFSLGVVCYELLTGVKPFGGDSISSVLYRIVHDPPRDAPLHLERIAPPLGAFLGRALAKDPASRHPDGAAFAAALRRAGAESAMSIPRRSDRPPPSPTPAPAPARRRASRLRSIAPWLAVGLGVAALGWAYALRIGPFGPTPIAMLTAGVRTEPGGLPVRLNGEALTGGVVRFPAAGPFQVLTTSQGCREAKHRLEAADAGREIVLVLDPARAAVTVDPSVPGARIAVNGENVGTAPATIELDLCRDNSIDIRAEGYQPARATIPEKATPLEARSVAAGLRLEKIPTGRLVFPDTRVPARWFVDGQPVTRTNAGLDLPAGSHEVRVTNDERFIDVSVSLEVPEGGRTTAVIPIPALARLVVQTFPPNCHVAIRRPGTEWRTAGDTPLRYELAAGRYQIRIESPSSSATRERIVDLTPGTNPPVRVSFGRAVR